MKTVKLKKKDAFDLGLVLGNIVSEKAEELDFKEIIVLQKASNSISETVSDFSTTHETISKERDQLMKAANKKIAGFKSKKIKEAEDSGDLSDYKETIDAFATMEMDSLKIQIGDEVNPKLEALYEGIGEEDVELSFEDNNLKMIVDNFEKFAKTTYTSKSRMIEVYDALTNAQG